MCCCGVVVITTAQLHWTKPEFRFCAGLNPARGVSEICDGEDLWQWFRLEIRLNAFRRSTIQQKQLIIVIMIIIHHHPFFNVIFHRLWLLFQRSNLTEHFNVVNVFTTSSSRSKWQRILKNCRLFRYTNGSRGDAIRQFCWYLLHYSYDWYVLLNIFSTSLTQPKSFF